MSRHIELLTGDKCFSCHMCLKTFKRKSDLSRHMRVHNGEKPFSCDVCKQAFKWVSSCNQHRKRHYGEKHFSCDVCQKAFIRKQEMTSHMMRIHTDERPFSCDVCQKAFRLKSNLSKHRKCHSSGECFTCDMCQKTFTQKCYLTRHMVKIHSDKRPFSCDVCQKTFRWKKTLSEHRKCHSSGECFTCDVCQRTFTHKRHLTGHMTRIHTDGQKPRRKVKTCSCDICSKSFKSEHRLTVHKRLHNDHKVFSCNVCQKLFPQKRHKSQVSLTNIGESSVCLECAKPGKDTARTANGTEYLLKRYKGNMQLYASEKKTYKESELEKNLSCFICSNKSSSCWFLVDDHAGNVLCDQCERSSVVCLLCDQNMSISVLRSHIGNHTGHLMYHTGQKTMGESTMCNDSITPQKNVVMRADTDEGKNGLKTSKSIMSCNVCNKLLKSDFIDHMVIHMDWETLTCRICQKSFKMKNSFVLHMKLHTSEIEIDRGNETKCHKNTAELEQYRESETEIKKYMEHVTKKTVCRERKPPCFFCSYSSVYWFLVDAHAGIGLCNYCERSSVVCLLCDQDVQISKLRIHIGSHTGNLMWYT